MMPHFMQHVEKTLGHSTTLDIETPYISVLHGHVWHTPHMPHATAAIDDESLREREGERENG